MIDSQRHLNATRIGAVVGLSGIAMAATGWASLSPHAFARGASALGSANPSLLVLSAGAFLLAACSTARAWRAGLEGCGVHASTSTVTARYAVGSLASSFSPAPGGEVVRVALLSQLVRRQGAAYTVAGICTAIAAIRLLITALVFGAVAWTTPATASIGKAMLAVVGVLALGILLCRFRLPGRLAHLSDAAVGLSRSPRIGLTVLAWVATTTVARVIAVACAVAAFGVSRPWLAALMIVPAVELASLIPFIPGNIGVTSAFVTFALRDRHVTLWHAVSVGVALHGIELAVGVCFGLGGLLVLGRPRLARRVLPALVAVVSAGALGLWQSGLT